MEQIRIARSFIAADSLAEVVSNNYDIAGPISCKMFSKLLRTQDNDHYRVNAGYLPLTHWLHDPERGGGRIIGEACHFIDYLTFLVGEAPVSVNAFGLPDDGKYREDNLQLVIEFSDGSVGTVQ